MNLAVPVFPRLKVSVIIVSAHSICVLFNTRYLWFGLDWVTGSAKMDNWRT